MAAWVASAAARRVELWGKKLVLPPALAARAAVLAFGAELVGLMVPYLYIGASDLWLSPGGRELAAAYLMPLAHAALLAELQRLVRAVAVSG